MLIVMNVLPFLTLLTALPGLSMHPCAIGAHNVQAQCGTFTVYENRAERSGRTIPLHFVLLKAEHPSGRVIAFNPGGPGVSASADAALLANGDALRELVTLRDRYDVLFLDVRGTGQSAPQQCDFLPLAHPELYFSHLWPNAIVKGCRDRLAAKANLSLYSTSAAADDLDDLRAALGYRKLALDGGSYGTRLYLAYARQHPDRVESIVLRDVAPPGFVILPLSMAGGFQSAITKLIAECKSDALCAKHYPRFASHFAAVAKRFERRAVSLVIRNDATDRLQTVQLSREVFFERLRDALYDPATAAYIPIIIEHAYAEDYTPLGQLVDQMSHSFSTSQAAGLNLSVTCAEDIPFITEDAIRRTSVNTWEGDVRVRAQQRACAIWNVHPVPATFVTPVRSSAPILMISNSDDPATPPKYAREALRYLPNARLILIKGGSHLTDTPCIDKIADGFVRAGTANNLNFSACSNAYHRPPFATSLREYRLGTQGNAALTARFRRIVQQLTQGRLDRTQLEPALSKQLSPQLVRQLADQIASAKMWKFSYISTETSRKGKTYTYTLGLDGSYFTATFTLDPQNRISTIDISP